MTDTAMTDTTMTDTTMIDTTMIDTTTMKSIDLEASNSDSSIDYTEPYIIPDKPIDNSEPLWVNICAKICIFIIYSGLAFPLDIATLYYAYNDSSCIHKDIPNFGLTMAVFLKVTGYTGIMLHSYFILLIIILKPKLFIAYIAGLSKDSCGRTLIKMSNLFCVAWTITGAIMFWKLMDNSICDQSVRTYINALLMINLAFSSLIILQIICSKE